MGGGAERLRGLAGGGSAQHPETLGLVGGAQGVECGGLAGTGDTEDQLELPARRGRCGDEVALVCGEAGADVPFLAAGRLGDRVGVDGHGSGVGGETVSAIGDGGFGGAGWRRAPTNGSGHRAGPVWTPAWAAARRDSGLDVRLHDLRHLAGTLTAQAGATLRETMDRLGHASTQATLRYQHVAQRRPGKIASAIDELIADEG